VLSFIPSQLSVVVEKPDGIALGAAGEALVVGLIDHRRGMVVSVELAADLASVHHGDVLEAEELQDGADRDRTHNISPPVLIASPS